MISMLMRVRWLILALMAALAFSASVEPAFAWIAGEAVRALRATDATILSIAYAVGPSYALIGSLRVVAEFSERILSKAVDGRLLLELQRVYMTRAPSDRTTDDISNLLYTAEVAKRGYEVVYKDCWRIPAQVVAVVIWQLSLSPDLVPLLLLAALPAVASVWLVGRRLEHVASQILVWQKTIAHLTQRRDPVKFLSTQEAIFKGTIRIAVLRWLTERGLDGVLWVAVILCGGLMVQVFPSLLPGNTSIADAAALLINLGLLMKPLSDTGKVYAKWREAAPAVKEMLPRSMGSASVGEAAHRTTLAVDRELS